MTPVALSEVALDRHSHASALWWLGLLYSRPARFEESMKSLDRRAQLTATLCLCLHQLPYMLAICIPARWLLFGWLGLAAVSEARSPQELWVFQVTSLALGLCVGIAVGVTVGIATATAFGSSIGISAGATLGIAFAYAGGIVFGVAGGTGEGAAIGLVGGFAGGTAFGATTRVAGGIVFAIVGGIVFAIAVATVFAIAVGEIFWVVGGIAGGIAFGLTVEGARRIAGGIVYPLAVALAGGLAFGLSFGYRFGTAAGVSSGLAIGVGFSVSALRAQYLLCHPFFLWPRPRAAWFPYHPVAWDDLCLLPFPALDRLLVAYAELAPGAAQREIDRLVDTYPSQRPSALKAQATVLARRAAEARDLTRLDEIVAGLPEGRRGFLGQTRRLREMVHDIAALQARIDALDRPFLRQPLAQLLCREIERFQRRVAGFHQPLAGEFRRAAGRWLGHAEEQLVASTAVLAKEPTRQVFRAGDPVDRDREAFVPRDAVTGEIERQVMLATGCPGLVLYGRRRTGKSTVLRNLGAFLPPQVRRVGLSMQDPRASSSFASLVERLVGELSSVVDEVPAAAGEDLGALFRCLEAVDQRLGEEGRRLLLSLDEYENVDLKIGQGVFPEDLLATLRESIQSHRHITWIFAGSHEITELSGAEWASYLVSARTVEVGPFTPAETRLLLTEPLKYSTLWPRDDPSRPRFEPGFWGAGGIERIHAEAGGWPHLVQLIAETTVDLLNDDRRTQVDAEILDRALDKAVVRGHTVLHQLMRGESTLPGEWDYLSAFSSRDSQPPPDDAAIARSLRHRMLVSLDGEAWRLRVPLMDRWLRLRG